MTTQSIIVPINCIAIFQVRFEAFSSVHLLFKNYNFRMSGYSIADAWRTCHNIFIAHIC